jgi:sterol desaturase/sphingolipid hydroxylase (fatty acid hydroxylase superfamily)
MAEPSAYDLAIALPNVVVAVAVAAEVAWLRLRGDRAVLRSFRTAAAMAGGALVTGAGYAVVLRATWEAVEPVALRWSAPPVPTFLAAFVLWDLVGWVYHWLGHHTAIGWAAHRPHHTGGRFDLTLGLRQSWLPIHGLAVHPLLALAGFDLRTIVVCAALSNGWQALEHTAAPVRFPRGVQAVVMTPGAHRHHHGIESGPVNLGPVFTVWDRLAGTWVDGPTPRAYGLGPADEGGAVAIELAGWRRLMGAEPVASTV